MDYKTTTEEAATSDCASRGGMGDSPRKPVFASLIQTATRELHASLQLLAARARFLTGASGVAIALQEDGQFVYCASTGTSVPETGTQADTNKETLRQCIQDTRAVRSSSADHNDPMFTLALPVIRKRKVSGFFELATSHAAFVDDDIQVVSRLAEMASIALDHMEAARHSENRMLGPDLGAAPEPIVSTLWHAPERVPAVASPPPNSPSPPPPVKIHACNSCGFPISLGRTFCLDCEEHPPSAVPTETALFTIEEQESWISAHGYTIASLLVTGLAAAIILWLR